MVNARFTSRSTLRFASGPALVVLQKFAPAPAVLSAASVLPSPRWAKSGALLGYGHKTLELYGDAASYVDRILSGAKPADLPAQAPVKYRLYVNLKTAGALGLTMSNALQLLADEMID